MKITANLEFDTFAEAEKVFRHLGMLGAPRDIGKHPEREPQREPDRKPVTTARHESALTNGVVHPTEAPAGPQVATPPAPGEGVTLDDLKAEFQRYVGRGGGRTAKTAKDIMAHHGVPTGRFNDVRPEQYAVLRRAFETAGPEQPLGEAA